MVDADGRPRLDLYKADNPSSYDEFARIIKPVLQRVWAEPNSAVKSEVSR